jgi:PAS domain S-box-containing protein
MTVSPAGRRAPHSTVHLLVAGAVLTVAVVLLSPASQEVRAGVSSFALVVLGVALSHGSIRNARRCGGRRQVAWRFFSAGAVTALAGNAWAAAVEADPATNPSVGSEVLIVLGLSFAVGALLSLRAEKSRGPELALLLLDGLVAGIAALLLATITVFSQVVDTLQGVWLHQVLILTMPFLDVVILTLAAMLLAENRSQTTFLSLVGGGFLLYALGDLVFAVRSAQGSVAIGTPLDLGWILGYALLVVATHHRDATRKPEVKVSVRAPVQRTALVFGLLLAALVAELVAPAGVGLDGVRGALWVALVAALGARQALLTADNAALRAGLERRVAEQTADLRRLARQNETLLTSVADGIYGVDREGRLTFANPAAARILGYEVAELLGRDPHDTFHAPRADGTPFPQEECYLTQAVLDDVTVSAEADRYRRADGSEIPVEVTASPLRDDGVVLGAVVAFRDMTQRHEVDRMKNEFLSVVSHELRTPLTSIRGSLGLLSAGGIADLNPAAERMLTIAVESSARLSRLINDILDIERIEAGRLPMEIEPHPASALVERCLREMTGMAQSSGVVLRTGEVRGSAQADVDRIVQALTNLVGNAIKFSPRGGVVTVAAGPDPAHPDRSVLFAVSDQGRGIPPDKLEAVFHPFEQVDSSDSRQHGGTGLGLAITQRIVEAHGGRIWASSALGEGTTMHFTLSLAAQPPVSSWPRGEDDAPSVLVVEDDSDLATVLSTLLSGDGLCVERVSTVAEATAWLGNRRADVVVVDLELPDGSGLDVVAGLEASDGESPAVVVYTGSDVEPEVLDRLHRAGAVVLSKGSVHPEELEARVLRLVDEVAGPATRAATRGVRT